MATTATSCPRCETRLYDNADIYGSYQVCLRCGFQQDYKKPVPKQHHRVQRLYYVGGDKRFKEKVLEVRRRHTDGRYALIIYCPYPFNNADCNKLMTYSYFANERKNYICARQHRITVVADAEWW